jgi:molybdate transport system regulatory protein
MMSVSDRPWNLRSKVWLELEGHPVIGEGRIAMLQAIHRHGSILHASREIGISYRRVRGAIRDMENTLGCPLVKAFRGGEEGGGAKLTSTAQDLVDSFNRVANGFQNEIDTRFREVFR